MSPHTLQNAQNEKIQTIVSVQGDRVMVEWYIRALDL